MSMIRTVGAGVIETPATVLVGWTPKTIATGVPAVTVVLPVPWIAAFEMSVAVTDCVPIVPNVIGTFAATPATNAVFGGRIACRSELVKVAVPVYDVATWSTASSAVTVKVVAVPAPTEAGKPLTAYLTAGPGGGVF